MIAPVQMPRAVSRWYPEGPCYWSTRPVRTLRALSHGPVAISFDPSLPPCVTRWTFSHDRHDGRVVVAFRDHEATSRLLLRWRLLADVIRGLGRMHRSLDVRDVLIDLSDGVGTDAPPSLLAFARRPGSRARHNSAYWRGADYVGLGPSAHGFRVGERRWNVRDWAGYERAVAGGTDPVAGTERLSDDQRHLERVYLALRTAEGLPASEAAGLSRDALQAAVDAGWLTEGGEGLCATPSGWLVLDELVPALTTSRSGG